jgi:hypothetical protein
VTYAEVVEAFRAEDALPAKKREMILGALRR